MTGHSTLKVAPSARVQETRATNVAFNRQSSFMDYGYEEMGVSQSFEEIVAEMEDDVAEDQSRAGSIASVRGRVDGVLAECPNDAMTTPTGTIQGGIDGDIQPLVGDGAGQWPEPPPKPNYAEWLDECDNANYRTTEIVGGSQTGADKQPPPASVCETTTSSNQTNIVECRPVSQCLNESKVSNFNPFESYETQFPTLGKPLILTTNVEIVSRA